MDAYRAWTEVDLDALAANLDMVRRWAGAGVRVMLVVKQDAYGHGAVAVAHHAVRCGVGALGVGSSSEALTLREAGIRLPILILGTVLDEELTACLRHDIHVGLHATDRCRSLQVAARDAGCIAKVHLNVDTGMGRLGVHPERALEVLRVVRASRYVELAGLMTHVSPTDGARDPLAHEQLARFDALLAAAHQEGLARGWTHVANSAALVTGLGRRVDAGVARHAYDTVRPGLAAYGALPPELPGADDLSPVMSLKSRVVFLKDVPVGTPVGYGATWRASRATRIATLSIGYGHGLPWTLRDGEVLIAGRRAPIVGRLSMDYLTVDVGDVPGVRVGEVATLVGTDGAEQLTLPDLARRAGTIPYELGCALGRLPRLFRGGDSIVLPGQAGPARQARGTAAAVPRSSDARPGASK